MLRYKGGAWLPGVPSRDLTDEEAAQFDIPELICSGLYELVADEVDTIPEIEKEAKHGRRYKEAS